MHRTDDAAIWQIKPLVINVRIIRSAGPFMRSATSYQASRMPNSPCQLSPALKGVLTELELQENTATVPPENGEVIVIVESVRCAAHWLHTDGAATSKRHREKVSQSNNAHFEPQPARAPVNTCRKR